MKREPVKSKKQKNRLIFFSHEYPSLYLLHIPLIPWYPRAEGNFWNPGIGHSLSLTVPMPSSSPHLVVSTVYLPKSMALLSWWGNWGILVMNKPFYFSIFSHLNILPDIFICIMTWFYRTVMRSKVKSIEPLEGKELWRKNSRRWEGGAAASRPLQASALLPALLLWPQTYSGQYSCVFTQL